jgi:hypothetical protein
MANPKMTSRTPPPLITQQSLLSCWAAALSSWLLAVNPSKAETQKNLIKKFGEDDESIKISKFQLEADKLGLTSRLITGSNEFMPERILERLKNSSVLLIGFFVSDPGEHPFWHDVVLYGVVDGKEASYAIMDPGPSGAVATVAGSDKAQYVYVLRKFFFPKGDNQQWLIGWSKTPMQSQVSVKEVQEKKP